MTLLPESAMKRSPAASTATPVGAVQFGGGGRTAVAAVARDPIAGDGGDDAGGEIDLADPVVALVGDEEVPGGVHRHARGLAQVRRRWPGRRRRCSPGPVCRRRW